MEVSTSRRDDLELRRPIQEAAVVLGTDESSVPTHPRDEIGVGDLPTRAVGAAHVADFARRHQDIQRGDGLLDRGERVSGMELA
jgi:hypothetical protein